MYADKIDINEVVMTEDYCKKWYAEWDKLGSKANQPLELLEKKKSSIGAFYVNLEKQMDIQMSATKEIGAKQESLKKFALKLQNMVADVRQCNTQQRADQMSQLNKQFEQYKSKFKACLDEVEKMSPDYIVM